MLLYVPSPGLKERTAFLISSAYPTQASVLIAIFIYFSLLPEIFFSFKTTKCLDSIRAIPFSLLYISYPS